MVNKVYDDNGPEAVRCQFADELLREHFVTDKSGVKMLEIQGASFVASDETIFGDVNHDYTARELDWYLSCSRNVADIPGGTPTIWKQVSSSSGLINSNYGYLIFHKQNFDQYGKVFDELQKNPQSRRAVMIYTRPSMHLDYNYQGMSDFICTNAVQYLIRDGFLDVVVQMRSNDVFYGYRNDRFWQKWVQERLVADLNYNSDLESLLPGRIYWQVGSLHVYEKDFYLVDYFDKTGLTSVKKSDYNKTFPSSPWTAKK